MTTKKPRNPDHVRWRHKAGPSDEVIEAQRTDLLTPVLYRQFAYYRQLGLRSRILGLPLKVAAVLVLLWRQVPSARELTKLLAREDLLWCRAVKASQQALNKRLLAFPAELFERVFKDLLPSLVERWQQRQKRPLPPTLVIARLPRPMPTGKQLTQSRTLPPPETRIWTSSNHCANHAQYSIRPPIRLDFFRISLSCHEWRRLEGIFKTLRV